MDVTDVKEYLTQHNQEFRKLVEQHKEYERQLDELLRKPYLNEQDQIQGTVIKKKKLAVKDQMQMLIYKYQNEHSVH